MESVLGVGVREIEPVGCAGAARWRDGGGWCTALGGRLRGEHVSGASTGGSGAGSWVVGGDERLA
jgi:hypothetical protein